MDNQQPDESISNPVAHAHHYVLKVSGLSCWAECDVLVGARRETIAAPFHEILCGEKLAGDNGPIVGSKGAVERAIEAAT